MSFDEIIKYQSSLIDTICQEKTKFNDCVKTIDIDCMIAEASVYIAKLSSIKKDIEAIRDKCDKLKKRSLKLEQDQQKQALKREFEKNRQLEREKHLFPVVIKSEIDEL